MILRKSIIALAALSVISGSALAYEGHGYRIISTHIKSSPNFNGGIIELSPKKSMYAYAMAMTYDSEGHIMDYVKVQSDHNISLSNETKQTKRYTYKFNLNCESAYQQFDREVEVFPGGTFTDSARNYGTVQKNAEGTWRINAATTIDGAEYAFHEAHAVLRVRR